MFTHTSTTNSPPDPLARARNQRIRTFIFALSVLNLPFLALGLLDLPTSPVTLVLVLIAYTYYIIYYLLLRAGYGTLATYGCTVVLLVVIGAGVHNTGGLIGATNVLYLLLLVSTGIVLNDERSIDVIGTLCLLGYAGLVLFQQLVPPPIFRRIYATLDPLLGMAFIVVMLVAMVSTWVLMRTSIAGLRRSTAALEQARALAEGHARENADLLDQIKAGNESLLATQERLRGTIEALTLPLIPLDQGVALLPLIGYLDEGRAERLVRGLLAGIHEQRTRVVILDITGLREVDSHVATALLQAASAARLLGTQVVLSGVGATTARTLIDLRADVSGIQTASRLSDALRIAAAT